MRRRVLVTGGSGQVGREILLSAPRDAEVFAPGSDELDIRNTASVADAFARLQPQLVINAAAYTAVDKSESEPELAFAVNGDGAGNVARACAMRAIPLIHLSTDYVFDGKSRVAYRETDTPNPLGVYGNSKLEGERQIRQVSTPSLILRVSWVFGATGSNFVKTMLKLATQDVVRVVDDQFGTPCAAADIAAALWCIAARPDVLEDNRLLHFSSTPVSTWFGFAKAIFETAAAFGVVPRAPQLVPITTDQYPTSARRPTNSVLDSSQLQHLLGMSAPDWRTSLELVLRAFGGHRCETS